MPTACNQLSRAAVKYVTNGFSLVLMHCPDAAGHCSCRAETCTSPGKHPRFSGWRRDPIRTSAEAREQIERFPRSNVAIVTGNGLLVLDIDPRNGGDEQLSRLENEHGKLPVGPTVLTGGGGRHFYFSIDRNVTSRVVAPGVEVKADGGCVVAPPSLHVSGQHYKWAQGQGPEILLKPAPSWVVGESQLHMPKARLNAHEACEGFQEGSRNVGMTGLAGLLIGKNIRLPIILSMLVAFDRQFNKPPLGEAAIETIVRSIATRELHKRRGPHA